MKGNNKTIIISCAGMGTRLGIGTTKAVVDVDGRPLIIRQLDLLKDYDDVRIVVGYQAEKIIELVKSYRSDVMFAFNYDFKTTGTAGSFCKGLEGAKEFVVTLDGDLLVHPQDFAEFLSGNEECIGGTTPSTDNPVLMTINENNEVISFSREEGDLEWTGLAMLKKERIIPDDRHVYQMIEPMLPIKVKYIRTKEIDTMNDYENAVNWIKNNYQD